MEKIIKEVKLMNSDELMHFGVKGMKWGKRKNNYSIGSSFRYRRYTKAANSAQRDADNLLKNGYKEDTSFQKGNLNFYIILFIENQKILNHKRQRNEKINQLETFNAISQNDKASNSDSTNLTLIPKKEGDDSNYSTPKRIKKPKKVSTQKKEEKKQKTNVITHSDYVSTSSPDDFMKYNFNYETDKSQIEIPIHLEEEDLIYVNKQQIKDDFTIVKKEENLPKKIWDSNIFSKKELRKQLGILESKWPRKIMDFDEEFVLKILSLCDNNWIKCQKYISSNIFKSLLQGMKAKKEELTINLFK